jgi:hypothetical protein
MVLPIVGFLILGLLLLKVTDPIPRKFLFTEIQIIDIDLTKRSKMAGVMLIIVVLFCSSLGFISYLKIKKVECFEEVVKVTGRLKNVEHNSLNGVPFTSFHLDNHSYVLLRDKGYLSLRNLIDNDSVSVSFFVEPGKRLSKLDSRTIVKVELFE